MRYSYTVFGAGRQGVALAYDLAARGEASRVVLAERDEATLHGAALRLRALLPRTNCVFETALCDVSKPDQVLKALHGTTVAISAAPYRFNALLAEISVDNGSSFCDLGGNTEIVRRELALDARARAKGVSLVPDCGLAPGLCNHLAAHAVATLEEPRSVRIFCGGLPERPVGPLGYKLVFSFEGLINEYSGFGETLRGGERVDVPALTEVEDVEFPAPIGVLEAAVTSGGSSTCPTTWRGVLERYEYKTLRWPGHWKLVRALFELGAFEPELHLRDGRRVEPRSLLRALFEERLDFPDVADLVLLRVVAEGRHGGAHRTLTYDLRDARDPATGFSAMERATAFPAALVACLQARGEIAPGAAPLEQSVPAQRYFDELGAHDVQVTLRDSASPNS
ncbi:MAG TPA: saccharopine dehydrogenase C-terminal domain-containing protein [Planctomycetota bacterium]|nr:saccharopine dehydrogenase C-terminal domain-containing protein [Planctomycetota bacterium]